MKLYMKQKVFSLKDKFTITDEEENVKYTVEGEFISLGKKLHIRDAAEEEVALVKQKLMTLLPKFEVYLNSEQPAVEIVKEFSFFKPKYTLRGTDWTIQGDFWAHDYKIMSGSKEIISISKVWLSWGDSFELDVESEADEILAVATVLAIDCVMDANEE